MVLDDERTYELQWKGNGWGYVERESVRLWDRIDDIMCDDITCDDLHLVSVAGMDDITCYDLNQECEITGLELMT